MLAMRLKLKNSRLRVLSLAEKEQTAKPFHVLAMWK